MIVGCERKGQIQDGGEGADLPGHPPYPRDIGERDATVLLP
jgi:hypothetical protein